jgi:hypothetical protein
MIEKWKQFRNTNYSASTFGKVRNDLTNKILKQSINKDGYFVCALRIDGKAFQFKSHRIIAEIFLDNKETKPTVNHLNFNKLDNKLENLEWATNAEQMKHLYSTGRNPWNKGLKNWSNHYKLLKRNKLNGRYEKQ